MVLLGGLWPVLFMAFTLYSNCAALGWSFSEAFVSSDIAVCLHSVLLPPVWPIVDSRLSII